MRNLGCLASFCVLLMLAGCSKSSDASPRKTSRPGPGEPPVCDHGSKELPPVFTDPSGHTASSMPSADLKIFERVAVGVDGVEFLSDPEKGFDAYSALQILAVQVRISSQLESLRLRVGPDRFTLETEKRSAILAEPTCDKDPPLQKQYLKGGDTVSGWVAFVVPKGLSKATLKTDLRKPFISIPLSLPSSGNAGAQSPEDSPARVSQSTEKAAGAGTKPAPVPEPGPDAEKDVEKQ